MIDKKTIKQILEYRKKGYSHRKISRELDVDPKTVRKYCIENGIESDDPLKATYSQEEVNEIKTMYLERGMTPSEIGRELDIPLSTVILILQRDNVRKPFNYGKGKSNAFNKPMPPLYARKEPVYYPDRVIKPKNVTINGKRYKDVSELWLGG